MKKLLLVLILVPTASLADLLLFSEDDTFHGCLDCSTYQNDSVCNEYGSFGSKYNNDSIWNKYGIGSKYNDNSPFNKYGTGLKIVDRNGHFYGYMSMSYNGETKLKQLLKNMWTATDGDYDEMRDMFCQQ
jgi:hypothetical protein